MGTNRQHSSEGPPPTAKRLFRIWSFKVCLFFGVCFLGFDLAPASDLVPIPELGLRLQRGFTIRIVADNDTAPDTWCMTFDSRGRLVVGNSDSIRTLTDTTGNGVADTATVFTRLKRGVMGMCFDGTLLYAVADEALMRFADVDGDGVADAPGVALFPLGFGEHGAHAIRKGPDGDLYLMAGNDTGFNQQNVTSPQSPITRIEGGALLRISRNDSGSECIAHGFRNCYDFEFNPLGDIFTYDSDAEGDVFLPWYEPTRLYHVGFAQHHGWRLAGYKRSWPRPQFYEDTVNTLWSIGRGSPTGVAIYRHTQFPPAYRDGLFFCDWTFGRIYYTAIPPSGSTYAIPQPDVFLEPMGIQGFAPTSIAVSPDGALYVSIGGRKTRGAVYRIDYAGTPMPPNVIPFAEIDLNTVLLAPQPLDAWSRATWYPVAERLGANRFAQVATDESVAPALRVRAIEVLTEVFDGVPELRIAALAQSPVAVLRARLAWSLGRTPATDAGSLALSSLASDAAPIVRRPALEALIERPELVAAANLARIITANLGSADKRIRMAAARLASRAPDDAWQTVANGFAALPVSARTGGLLAQMWRSPESVIFPQVVPQLTTALAGTRDTLTRLDVVRLMILSLGDWHLTDPSVEVFTGYEPPSAVPNEFNALLRPVRALLPSGNIELDTEAARLLAMLQDDDPRTARVLAQFLTDTTPASQDFHFLICLARLRAPLIDYVPRISHAVLNLDRKLSGQELRTRQNWNARLAELVEQLIRREPAIADAMLRDPRFPLPAHVDLARAFEGERRTAAARRFFNAARASSSYPWTGQLVDLLAELPRDEVFPLFRRHAYDPGVRDAIVLKLASAPVPTDRPLFLGSLSSPQPPVVRASLDALLKLPPDPSNTNLVAPLRLLRRELTDPQATLTRAQLVALLSSSLKQQFTVHEPLGSDIDAMKAAYQPIFDWVGRKYPGLMRLMNSDDGEDPVRWAALLRTAPWQNGNAIRGEQIFLQRGCAACHGGNSAIGPDLAGAVQRMSRDDAMNAIAFPSRDVAPAYRATLFRLRNGETINGIIAFESADGWIVQTGAGTSVRLDSRDVLFHQPSAISIMPNGLLAGLSPVALADLYAYLTKSLIQQSE